MRIKFTKALVWLMVVLTAIAPAILPSSICSAQAGPLALITGLNSVQKDQNITFTGAVQPNGTLTLKEAEISYDANVMEFQALSSLLPGVQASVDAQTSGVLKLTFSGQGLSLSGVNKINLFAATFKAKAITNSSLVSVSKVSFEDANHNLITTTAVNKSVAIYTPEAGSRYESFDTYANGNINGVSGYSVTPTDLGYFTIKETPTSADKSLYMYKTNVTDTNPSTCTKIYDSAGISGKVKLSYQIMQEGTVTNPQSFINVRDKSSKVIATVIMDSAIHATMASDNIIVSSGELKIGMWYLVTLDMDFDAHTVGISVREMSGDEKTWTMNSLPMQNVAAANFSKIEYTLWRSRTGAYYYNNVAIEPQKNTINPVSADFDKYIPQDVNVTVSGNTVTEIKNVNQHLADGIDYTVTGSVYSIKKEYLAAQPVGVTKLTFGFQAGEYKDLSVNITDTTPIQVPTEYYVSPTGNDNNPGTLSLPFATLQKAQETIRNTKGDMTEDITVYLRGGNYNQTSTWMLDERDSGNNGHSIIYKAYGDEKPVIEGGKQITGWTLYDAEKNIYSADGTNVQTRQLYVNGIRAVRARTAGGLTNGVKTSAGYTSDDTWLAGVTNQTDIECVFKAAWTSPRVGIQSITEQNGKAVITLNQSLWSSIINRSHLVQWYLENAYEFIDEEGEWYLNDNSGKIYYKPRSGENMATASVTVPVLQDLVTIQGSSLDTPVKNIRFEGIAFSYTTWMKPSTTGGWVDEQNNYNVANLEMPAAAINIEMADGITFERCEFSKLGSTGINLLQGVQNNLVIGSKFFDISGSAINAGQTSKRDPNVYNPSDGRLILKNNDIISNYIHDIGVEYKGATAIDAAFPMDIDISHNEIFNIPYSGISFFGSIYAPVTTTKNARIENNFIHDLMGEGIFDGGGIYFFGVTSGTMESPNMVSGNYIKNQKNRYAAIYMDQSSSYWKIEKNVVDLSEVPIWDDIYDTNWSYTNVKAHDILFDDNYSTNGYFWNQSAGANIVNTNVHIYPDANWPQQAETIIADAGLLAEYKDIALNNIEKLNVPKSLNLSSGSSYMLNVSASTGKDIPTDISAADIFYVSKNPSIATVDGNGKIEAVGKGNTDIILYVYFKGSLTKRVIPVYVDDVLSSIEVYYALENVKHVVPDSMTFATGSTRQLIARGISENGQILSDAKVQFSSSNSTVATVVNGQLVTLEPGIAMITVTTSLNGVTVSRTITVNVVDYSNPDSLNYPAYSMNGAIRSPGDWYVNLATGLITPEDGSIDINTPGNGFATYKGKTFGNQLLTMNMKINAVGGWPAIVLRNQKADKDFLAADNSLYMICIKPSIIELHRFSGGQRTVFYGDLNGFDSLGGASCPNTAMPLNQTHLVQVGAINENDGVRIVLNVDGKNVFSYLDTSDQRITADGYFGLYARSGSFTLSETNLGIPGEDERPPLTTPVASITGLDSVPQGQNITFTGAVQPNGKQILKEAEVSYDANVLEFKALSSVLPGVQVSVDAQTSGILKLTFSGEGLSLYGTNITNLFAVTFNAKAVVNSSVVTVSKISFVNAYSGEIVTTEAVNKPITVYTPEPGSYYESFDTYPNGNISGVSGYTVTPKDLGYFTIKETPTSADKSLYLYKETTTDSSPSGCIKVYSSTGISGKVRASYQVMKEGNVTDPQSFINIRDNSGKVIATVIMDTTLHVSLAADNIVVGGGELKTGMWYIVTLEMDFDAHTVGISAREMSGGQKTWTMNSLPMQNVLAANFSRIEYTLWSTRTGAYYYNNLSIEPYILPNNITPVSADFDKYKPADVDVTVSGNTLIAIKNGTQTLVNGTDYTNTGSVYTIKKEYLLQQPEGITNLTFYFDKGDNQQLGINITDTTPDTRKPVWNNGSVTYTNLSQTGLTLTWAGASDNTAVTTYAVYKDGTLLDTVTDCVYNVTGLSEGTNYSFRIEAGDAAGNWSNDGPEISVTTIGPPVINAIGEQTVNEGTELMFTVSASDPNGDNVFLTAENLPEGAVFDANTGLFTWTPGFDKAGNYEAVFKASDGTLISEATAKITVNNVQAKALTEGLKDYVNGMSVGMMGVGMASKNLLVKELDDITSSLAKDQYQLALVKLKVFMKEVKIAEPKAITAEQSDYLLDASLDICAAIVSDAQDKDQELKAKGIEKILKVFEQFKEAKEKNDTDILEVIDNLTNIVK